MRMITTMTTKRPLAALATASVLMLGIPAFAQQPAPTDTQIDQALTAKLQGDATYYLLFAQKLQRELMDAQKRISDLMAKCGKACEAETAKPEAAKPEPAK